MATDDLNLPPQRSEETPVPAANLEEIALTDPHLQRLQQAVSRAFSDERSARSLLRTIGFPREEDPAFAGRARDAWDQVFFLLEQGIVVDAPYLRLLSGALARFRGNPVLLELARIYGVDPLSRTLRTGAESTAPAPSPEPRTPQPTTVEPVTSADGDATCHVIVGASTEDERLRIEGELRHARLDPRLHWSTNTAQSFALNTGDASFVRRALDSIDNLGWIVVPAGQPDYVLRNLVIEGPDRRRFEVTDAPAQETIRDLAEEVLTNHYPQSEGTTELPTLVEHVHEGQRRAVNPDSTLHDAGVEDGDQLSVAYQTQAGAVHPQRHEDALLRARNQIRAFAASDTARDIDFELGADAPLDQLPTAYELAFTQRSFGYALGADERSEVIEVDRHVVSLQLGPEFPVTPPQLWWLTPILHPNIYPNYPSAEARQAPDMRGLVCLGIIGETWQDTIDFGDMCRMLVEMAGFRNYSPFEIVETPEGPEFKGNSYDVRAARWVVANQDRIRAIGGEFLFPHRIGRRTYRNVMVEVQR